jgi:heme O synthase-like polyprenyltransferase
MRLYGDFERKKYIPRSKVITSIMVFPFILIAIFVAIRFNWNKFQYLVILITISVMSGSVYEIVLKRLIDREIKTTFDRILIFLNDHIWRDDP